MHFHEITLKRPYRLAVRTQGSHPCNSGSIPDGVTRHRKDAIMRLFLLAYHLVTRTTLFDN